jgi:hypothetical protein
LSLLTDDEEGESVVEEKEDIVDDEDEDSEDNDIQRKLLLLPFPRNRSPLSSKPTWGTPWSIRLWNC